MWYYECLSCGNIDLVSGKQLKKLEKNSMVKCKECESTHLAFFWD